jgi:hypothetical protein
MHFQEKLEDSAYYKEHENNTSKLIETITLLSVNTVRNSESISLFTIGQIYLPRTFERSLCAAFRLAQQPTKYTNDWKQM